MEPEFHFWVCSFLYCCVFQETDEVVLGDGRALAIAVVGLGCILLFNHLQLIEQRLIADLQNLC